MTNKEILQDIMIFLERLKKEAVIQNFERLDAMEILAELPNNPSSLQIAHQTYIHFSITKKPFKAVQKKPYSLESQGKFK